jgi:hypothetical protein
MKALSAPALNYGILLSTPLKNFKDEKTAEGKKQIGVPLAISDREMPFVRSGLIH